MRLIGPGAIPPRMSKPSINDIIRGLQSGLDLLAAGDEVVSAVETTAGLIRRYREQARKATNASASMQAWHRWRRDRLAERIRDRLGLAATDPIPAPPVG